MALLLDDEMKKRAQEIIEQLKNMPVININNNNIWAKFTWDNAPKEKEVVAEQDEQGTFYGYKVLVFSMPETRFYSLVYPVRWEEDGSLVADVVPTEENRHGIYFMKTENDEEIKHYDHDWERRTERENYFNKDQEKFVFVVKCALSGTIVEGERGFRAEQAQVIGVKQNGYWRSYEDTYASAKAYQSRKNYEKRRAEYYNYEPPYYTRRYPD